MMMKFQLLCVLVGLATGRAAFINRPSDDVRKFRAFLDATNTGTYEEPSNSQIAALQNTEELSGKFEGDILLTEEQKVEMVMQFERGRNAVTGPAMLWPNKVLYYTIDTSFFNDAQVAAIKGALQYIEYEYVSCVRFSTAANSNVVVVIGKDQGCYSNVGLVGGKQYLNLAPASPETACFRNGTIVHEFLHALGFYHMQSTYDRDDYMQIVWSKIAPGKEGNFLRYSPTQVTNLGVPYDYGSVLHYSLYGFTTDGNKTMIPLKFTTAAIGQRLGMSPGDIIKLNRLYKCPGFF